MTRRRNRRQNSVCGIGRQCPPEAFSQSILASGGHCLSILLVAFLLVGAVSCRPTAGTELQNFAQSAHPSQPDGWAPPVHIATGGYGFAAPSLLSADGKRVTGWMMGTSRLYPSEFAPLPSSPAGYKPVYITHYGRHGSRYLVNPGQYAAVNSILEKAAADSMLTPEGQRIWQTYSDVYPLLDKREGELTPLGAMQHRGIARRMVGRYPSLFKKNARIEANSTNLERTMLSMFYFTRELLSLRPGLDIHADASRSYMGVINQHTLENPRATEYDVQWKKGDGLWRPAFDAYVADIIDPEPFCKRLFADYDYLRGLCDPLDFERTFFDVAMNFPSCGFPNILDAFTSDELLLLGRLDNCSFYIGKSRFPGGDKRGCYLSEAVLGDIIDRVEPDIESGVRVRLRFGHDGCMMALLAMLKVDGWGAELEDFSRSWEVWDVSQIPMAANLQLVFFRGRRGDLIFLPLLNEQPLSLPLESIDGAYYSWERFVTYCGPILREAREALSVPPVPVVIPYLGETQVK